MKHSKLFIFAIMTTLAVSGCKHQAATYPTDTLTTKNGSQLTITFFKHASLAIETEGRHIYIDPISQYADYASLPKADLLLLTPPPHPVIATARDSAAPVKINLRFIIYLYLLLFKVNCVDCSRQPYPYSYQQFILIIFVQIHIPIQMTNLF